ncbi:carboxypeptidase-like regulatory domain-containing protein [Xanthovirga aplysinae]|uniref:carboxypeptidase-like regulatory domain-containing protein n=1 Tax=Xanthovirga aplysinae TaxID=2529853 RepID=UPI0012BC2A1C|nr:carboxypeptidase-like regulatory domain-containing protein [Xanthovirga aplysinae]MTI33130.1 hypothetical protein [Xanthovirga aplysinae]
MAQFKLLQIKFPLSICTQISPKSKYPINLNSDNILSVDLFRFPYQLKSSSMLLRYLLISFLFLGIFLLILPNIGWAQQHTSVSQTELSGKLINKDDQQAAEFVHLINLNKKLGTITNENGIFKIIVSEGDKIVFSSVEYEMDTLTIENLETFKKDGIVVSLKPAAHMLDPLKIDIYPEEEEFKKRILSYIPEEEFDLNLPKEAYLSEKFKKYKEEDFHDVDNGMGGDLVKVGIPTSFITEKFSKKAKERKKLALIKQEKGKQQLIHSKFNRDIVSDLTSLKGSRLDQFMEYCKFTEEFLLKSSKYEVLEAINKKFLAFQNEEDPYNKMNSNQG